MGARVGHRGFAGLAGAGAYSSARPGRHARSTAPPSLRV